MLCKNQLVIENAGTVLEITVRCVCPVCCGDGRVYADCDTEQCIKCLGSGEVTETVYRSD